MVPKHEVKKQQNHVLQLLVCATVLYTSTRTYITKYDDKSMTEN
jgi:hypothetical protein